MIFEGRGQAVHGASDDQHATAASPGYLTVRPATIIAPDFKTATIINRDASNPFVGAHSIEPGGLVPATHNPWRE